MVESLTGRLLGRPTSANTLNNRKGKSDQRFAGANTARAYTAAPAVFGRYTELSKIR